MCFPEILLRKDDAHYVVVVHTNGDEMGELKDEHFSENRKFSIELHFQASSVLWVTSTFT